MEVKATEVRISAFIYLVNVPQKPVNLRAADDEDKVFPHIVSPQVFPCIELYSSITTFAAVFHINQVTKELPVCKVFGVTPIRFIRLLSL